MIAGDILGERARLTPERLALFCVATGERFTYKQLNERAIRCAMLWSGSARLVKGDRVGILAHNSTEFIEAFFAAGKSGIILVPLNPRHTARELDGIVRDAGLRALMYEHQFAETVEALRNSGIETFIALDGRCRPGDLDYHEAIRKLDSGSFYPQALAPDDIYCLLYTSGTTGKSKGVMVPHRMILWNAYNTAMCWQLREDDVSPIFTPLCHAGGLTVFLTPIFAAGGTIVLHRHFDPEEIWATMDAEHCSVVMGVPTIYKMLMESPGFQNASLKSVRWFISGGAPLPLYLIDAYQRRGITFKQGYGLTEVGVNCFSMTEEESRSNPGSIGKPMMFTEARLLVSNGKEAAPDEVGELCLRGPHVCLGYWQNPEATAASIDSAKWFHTGDLAKRDDNGFYYIAGRSKDMLISGGINVYPAEIEAELLLHPQVQDAAVVGIPHETWGEMGVAFVVLRQAESPPASEQLAEFLSARLAKYKVPREFVFIEALPRTPYGKVVKRELQERYEREHRAASANSTTILKSS